MTGIMFSTAFTLGTHIIICILCLLHDKSNKYKQMYDRETYKTTLFNNSIYMTIF